jgi:formamidopyrimidine-DNA glycosylase
MPELPEVETVVRDLRPLVAGRRVTRVEAGTRKLREPWSTEWGQRLRGRNVRRVWRRGKWIILDLDDGSALVVHLGMTGRFTAVPAAAPREPHTHLVFTLDNGTELRFRDTRRFGSVRLFADAEAVRQFLDARLGPEPFDLPKDAWRQALRGTQRSLKAVLLDQSVVAGVGNIYADEALHAARLPPHQRGSDTTPAQAERLRRAVAEVLERAIASRGSTIRDYVGGSGLQGGFQEEFRVYGRTGKPCPTCGRPVERVRLAGRSTHYCPQCQRTEDRGQRSGRTASVRPPSTL